MAEPRVISHEVDLEPVGRRVAVPAGQTILDAARAAGVELTAVCGGEGSCYSCLVKLQEGKLSPVTMAEEAGLSAEQLAAGYRLACQAEPLSDVKVEIPPESLATQQRLQLEGEEMGCALDPVVVAVDVMVEEPTLHDLRADVLRVQDAMAGAGFDRVEFAYPVLQELPSALRRQGWSARLAVRREGPPGAKDAGWGEVVGVTEAGRPLLGLAVDIGTTKIAAYLVDLQDGRTLARGGAVNPQVAYGEDVVSRIAYTLDHPDGRRELQRRVADTLNKLVVELCLEAGAGADQVVDGVVVGNTAMHHLFAGLPVEQLGRAPYVPVVSDPLDVPARTLGLEGLAAAAYIHLPSTVAGYVGADHVAMAMGAGAWESTRTLVAVDIGTNTEVTLAHGGRVWSCSCASGPAFEGAHVRDGMRAAPGAIERVQIVDGLPRLKTVGDRPPVGICGSGILDAIGELLKAGIVDRKGNLLAGAPGVEREDGMLQYVLADAASTGSGRAVVVTRKDINEIQLAKAAIRTGVEVLLMEAGIGYEDVEEFIVAGAFGTYLDLRSTIRTGMFPPLPLDRFKQVGNAAGAGARQMLVSASRRALAARLARGAEYVELTVHPAFTSRYLKALYFPEADMLR